MEGGRREREGGEHQGPAQGWNRGAGPEEGQQVGMSGHLEAGLVLTEDLWAEEPILRS